MENSCFRENKQKIKGKMKIYGFLDLDVSLSDSAINNVDTAQNLLQRNPSTIGNVLRPKTPSLATSSDAADNSLSSPLQLHPFLSPPLPKWTTMKFCRYIIKDKK